MTELRLTVSGKVVELEDDTLCYVAPDALIEQRTDWPGVEQDYEDVSESLWTLGQAPHELLVVETEPGFWQLAERLE